MDIKVYSKRSLAMNFFKNHFTKKTKAYLSNLIYLVVTPTKELGWIAKAPDTGKMFLSDQKNKEKEISSMAGCTIISPETAFMFKKKVFLYKHNRITKDNSIVFLKMVYSVIYAEQLYPNTEFQFYLVKDEQEKIINCAWVGLVDNKTVDIPIFQEEPEYDSKKIHLTALDLDEEFTFLGKRWYTCTEKGKCILAELP